MYRFKNTDTNVPVTSYPKMYDRSILMPQTLDICGVMLLLFPLVVSLNYSSAHVSPSPDSTHGGNNLF